MRAILKGFYSTVVVNLFSWNKAYAIYPLLTFIQHKGYLLHDVNDHIAGLLNKYCKRGWKHQSTAWPEEEQRENHPMRSSRRVGDRYTWKISLGTSNVTRSQIPDDVIEYSSFSCDETRSNTTLGQEAAYIVHADYLNAQTLRYRYLWGSWNWMTWLVLRTDKLTLLEVAKLNPSDRPDPVFQRPLHTTQINKPDTWTYWDSEISKWYHQWEVEAKKSHGVSKFVIG